jgi:hypothetical protein
MANKRTASGSTFGFPTTFQEDKFTYVARSMQEGIDLSFYSTSNQNSSEMIIYSSLYRAFIHDSQLHFGCDLMFVTWSFLKRTVTLMNKSYTAIQQRRTCIFYVSRECRTEQTNIFKFLVVPTRRHITMKFKITNSAGKLLFPKVIL